MQFGADLGTGTDLSPSPLNRHTPGGHNMGTALELLGAATKAIDKAAIVDYATNCATTPDWWTKKGGGEASVPGCSSTIGLPRRS